MITEEQIKQLRNVVKRAMQVLREGNVSYEVIGTGAAGDLTKAFDKEVEEMLVNGIVDVLGDVLIVSEELGTKKYGNPKWVAIIDPVDGSTNYDAGIPWVAISVAIAPLRGGKAILRNIELAFVGDVFGNKIYEFSGGNVKVNGEKVERLKEPKNVLLGYFESPDAYSIIPKYWKLRGRPASLRSLGSIALEIVYVGLGRAEALTDLRAKVRNLDVAAAYKIAEALGAKGTMCGLVPLSELPIDRIVKVKCVLVGYDEKVLDMLLKALSS